MWNWHGMDLWGWLIMFVFWSAVVLLIVWATKRMIGCNDVS